jgi:putative oxidoreductase
LFYDCTIVGHTYAAATKAVLSASRMEIRLMLNDILTEYWSSYTHTALRIMAGLLFLQHGTAKLLKFPAIEAFKGGVGGLELVAGVLQLVGGVLIILGLFTQTTAFILSGFMAVAYFKEHASGSFFPIVNGGELAILFCFVFLWLATEGAGPFSIDAWHGQ